MNSRIQSDLITAQNALEQQKQQWTQEMQENQANHAFFETKSKKLDAFIIELQDR